MNKLQQLADKLNENGIKQVFGVSGSGPSYSLINALIEKGVNYTPVSHEATAAIAAGTCQYLSGNLSASVTIKGPGFVNALAGITACWFEKYPMLSISEEYDDSAPAARMHKRLNQLAMVSPVSAKVSSLTYLDEVDGFLEFIRGDETPHHFQLCEMTIPAREVETVKQFQLDHSALDEIKRKIQASKAPVLIIGSLIKRLSMQEAIGGLQLPVFTSVQAKGLINERLSHAAGIYTGSGLQLSPEKKIIPQADLVITLGVRNHEILGVADKKIFINLDTVLFAESPETQVCSEGQLVEIIQALMGKNNWAEQLIATCRQDLEKYRVDNGWMPAEAFSIIDAQDFEHGLVLDTGTFCTIGEHFWNASPSRPFIGSSNGRNMGIGIPTSLGASLAVPGLPWISVAGDGGIRYYLSELRTFKSLGLPVCFVFMTDGRYGSIACNIPDEKHAHKILEPKGDTWTDIVGAMGIPSCKVNDWDSFRRALARWDKSGPMFIEMPFDPEKYKFIASSIR